MAAKNNHKDYFNNVQYKAALRNAVGEVKNYQGIGPIDHEERITVQSKATERIGSGMAMQDSPSNSKTYSREPFKVVYPAEKLVAAVRANVGN